MSIRTLSMAAALLLLALPALPARADTASELEKAERLAREGAEQLLNALQAFIGSIPQYELPEMMPNGDIIIRRKRDEPAIPGRPAPDEARPGDVLKIDA